MELEAFIDDSIAISIKHKYHPTTFKRMREEYGTVDAISRLVVNGEIQSGFKKMSELGLIEYTIESAVLKFPNQFTKNVQKCAKWRLDQAR
jgi:hypothetical protein